MGEMLNIWDFLGVEAPAEGLKELMLLELQQNQTPNGSNRRPGKCSRSLRKVSKDPGDSFYQRDIQIFNEVAGQTLRAWGYEV
jgi:hypothetical protein